MFVIEAVRGELRELEHMSGLIHLGLTLMVAALAAAVLLQAPATAHEHTGHLIDQHLAHGVALLGMAFVMAGVALDARRHTARRASLGGSHHAHR